MRKKLNSNCKLYRQYRVNYESGDFSITVKLLIRIYQSKRQKKIISKVKIEQTTKR